MRQNGCLTWIALCVLTVLALVGCGGRAEQAPDVPRLSGRLILHAADLRQWYQVSLQGDFTTKDITGETFYLPGEDPISPNGRILVESMANGPWGLVSEEGVRVALVAEEDGEELTPDRPFDDECARWSPDGEWVAVLDPGGLYVAGVDGKARLALERRWEAYLPESPSLTDVPTHAFSSISCPSWIGPSAMVVDHFTGPFPEKIETITTVDSMPGGMVRHEELDTTSVLSVLESDVETRALPSRWSVVAVSPDSAVAVLLLDNKYSLASTGFLITGQGEEPLQLEDCSYQPEMGQTFPCSGVRFSPDSRRLAYDYAEKGGASAYETGSTLRVWDVPSESMILSLERTPEQSSFGDLLWSPDGDALAYGRGWQKPEIFVALVEERRVVELPVEYTFDSGAALLGWLE